MPAAPPATVAAYLEALPADRRAVVEAVRAAVNAHLPAGYAEGIQYRMIGWYVPHTRYPAGYKCDPKIPLPFIQLAAQKAHFALYLMCLYGSPELNDWFVAEYRKTGKKLDMGKGCVRFKRLEDLPLDLVGRLVARLPVTTWIAAYEAAFSGDKATKKPATKKPAAKKPAAKKPAAKKPAAKKPAAKKPARRATG